MSRKRYKIEEIIPNIGVEIPINTYNNVPKVWDTQEKIIKVNGDIKLYIPLFINMICNRIARDITDEFSILTKIDKIEDGDIYLMNEYVIPKQEVGGASVEMLEHIEGYDVVIHRHPHGVNDFSSTDENSINSNFRLSILYIPNNFIKFCFNTHIDNLGVIQIHSENIIIQTDDIEVIGMDNIKKKEYKYNFGYKSYYPEYINNDNNEEEKWK